MEPKERETMWGTKKPYKQHTSYDLPRICYTPCY